MKIQSLYQTGDIPYWLALMRAPGIGPATFMTLLQRYGKPESVFDVRHHSHAEMLTKPTLDYLRNPDWFAVEKDLAWRELPGNHILTLHDPRYPPLLKEISDSPPVLFVSGDINLLTSLQIAIVGSRNPSPVGKEITQEFAALLSQAGLTITSGMALGIDAAAHRGALDNNGPTLAVMGNGLDQVYPARHQALAKQIATTGALVSEYVPGTPPLAVNFPRRNRIISGLSLGTLVVEAALRSGSLITARCALEQGREVFAIPGSLHNPLARGCHQLIHQGAKLVENIQDIIEELGPLSEAALSSQTALSRRENTIKSSSGTFKIDEQQTYVLDCLGSDPTSIDTLVERSGLTAEALSSILLVLELHNQVASAPGGAYIRLGQEEMK